MTLLFIFLEAVFWEFLKAWVEVVFLQRGFAFLPASPGTLEIKCLAAEFSAHTGSCELQGQSTGWSQA